LISVEVLNMATLTITKPEGFDEVKKKYPEVDWNEVLKIGILKRLEELKKFDELKRKGVI
jgi:hypothetical protein